MSVRNRVRTLTRTTVCSSDPVVARRERNTGGPRPGRSISGATASVLAALLISTSVGVAFGAPVSGFDGTETIHDRKVHLEEKLIERIPAVPRLCLSADTTKRRIAVGDCKLFCELEGDGVPLVLLHGGPGATHHYFHAAFAQAGPFAKVIYYLEVYLERHPGDTSVLFCLATLYARDGRLGQARDALRTILTLEPGNAEAAALIKEVEEKHRKVGEARER